MPAAKQWSILLMRHRQLCYNLPDGLLPDANTGGCVLQAQISRRRLPRAGYLVQQHHQLGQPRCLGAAPRRAIAPTSATCSITSPERCILFVRAESAAATDIEEIDGPASSMISFARSSLQVADGFWDQLRRQQNLGTQRHRKEAAELRHRPRPRPSAARAPRPRLPRWRWPAPAWSRSTSFPKGRRKTFRGRRATEQEPSRPLLPFAAMT